MQTLQGDGSASSVLPRSHLLCYKHPDAAGGGGGSAGLEGCWPRGLARSQLPLVTHPSRPVPTAGRGLLCAHSRGRAAFTAWKPMWAGRWTEGPPLSFPAMREAQFTPLSPSPLPSEDWHCHSILPLPETRQEQVQATPSAAPSAPNACCCLQTAPWAGGPGSPDELREPHRGSGGSGPRQRPELGSPPPGRSAESLWGTGVPRPSEGGHVCLQR